MPSLVPRSLKDYLRLLVLLLVVILVAAWQWTPLGEWVNKEQIIAFSQALQQAQVSPFWVVPCMIVASLLMMPLSLLVILSGLLYGPYWGFCYALLSGVISGTLGYYLGRFLGREAVQKLAGERVNKISSAIGKRGIMAAIGLRVVPFAPFTVQNMMAGASHINQRDFNIGNAIGLVPATAFILLVMTQLSASIATPDAKTIVTLVVSILGFALLLLGLRHWFVKRLHKQ